MSEQEPRQLSLEGFEAPAVHIVTVALRGSVDSHKGLPLADWVAELKLGLYLDLQVQAKVTGIEFKRDSDGLVERIAKLEIYDLVIPDNEAVKAVMHLLRGQDDQP